MLEYFSNRTILITGGSGYLGSHILEGLSHCNCNIIIFDQKPPASELSRLAKAEWRFVKGNITDPSIWKDLLNGVDIVFYLAAQTSSKLADQEPLKDYQINVEPVAHFISACREHKYKPDVVFAGTATQVGITENYPVDESVEDKPVTVYDADKLKAENLFKDYAKDSGCAVTLRIANLYGPGPKSSNADRGILNMMVKKAVNGEDLTVYGDGEFVRDYVYVDDVRNAFLMAAVHVKKLNGGHFLIGSGKGNTFKEMVQIIQKKVHTKPGKDISINFVKPPEGLSKIEFRNFVADTRAFSSLTQWKAETLLEQGIENTIDYFLQEAAA